MALTFLVLVVACTVAANLLLKTGVGTASGGIAGTDLSGLINVRVVIGLMAFGLAFVFYALALQRVPLNVAQSFLVAQFVGVIIASAVVLGEPISPLRWAGIALIAGGIAIVAYSN
ncbi:MAG: EamA family transporter [Pseudomonadota bacterium]